MKKTKTQYKLALAFFKLENTKGHMKWSVTDLARVSNVSRSLIYKYYGKSKPEIMLKCLRGFIEVHYTITASNIDGPISKDSYTLSTVKAKERLAAHPEAVAFYYRWRNKEGPIREEFIKIEKQYFDKIKSYFPAIDNDTAYIIFAIIQGLVTSPFMSSELTATAVKRLLLIGNRLFNFPNHD